MDRQLWKSAIFSDKHPNNDIFRIPAPEGEPRLARRHSRPRSLTVPPTAREPRVS